MREKLLFLGRSQSVLMGDYIKHVSFELGFIGKVRE